MPGGIRCIRASPPPRTEAAGVAPEGGADAYQQQRTIVNCLILMIRVGPQFATNCWTNSLKIYIRSSAALAAARELPRRV